MLNLVPLSQFRAQQGGGSPAGVGTPKYADIWQHLYPSVGTGANGPQADSPAGTWTPGYYTTERIGGSDSGTDTEIWHPGVFTPNANLPEKYRGMLTGYDNASENAQSGPSGQSQLRYDVPLMDKLLPSTKFGKFAHTGLMSLGSGKEADTSLLGDQHMGNPNAKYYDENYGWITPSKNVIENRHFTDVFADTIMPMLASAGFGALAAPVVGASFFQSPAFAQSLIGAARTFGDKGDWKSALMNIAPGIVGGGLSGAGINLPPELSQALRYAKSGYGAYNAFKRGNPAGGAMTLAQLFGR